MHTIYFFKKNLSLYVRRTFCRSLFVLPDEVLDSPPPTEPWSYEKAAFQIADLELPVVGGPQEYRAR